MDYQRLLLDNLDLIDQVVRGVAHRHRLTGDEADDLRNAVELKLIEDDYDVLRRFEQRCSLRTYLTTVVLRFFLDGRNKQWGKWRPSIEARRLGPVAVLLERLLTRDGVPFDQAVQILQTNHHVTQSRDELYDWSLGFPHRTHRHFVDDAGLDNLRAFGDPHQTLEEEEHRTRASAVAAALAAAVEGLDPQDRLILKMRYQDNLQFARIAALLKIEAKPFYRRKEQVLRTLRRALEERGIRREDIEVLTGSPTVDFEIGGDGAGNPGARPSHK